jgi:hypothetical protein
VRIDGSVPALQRIDCVHKLNSEATDSPRFISFVAHSLHLELESSLQEATML